MCFLPVAHVNELKSMVVVSRCYCEIFDVRRYEMECYRPREMSDRAIWSAGAIKTMQEKGIPIDYIGGTSIGAFVSGAFAMEEGTGFDARQPH